jgi:hypothetical protein
MARNNSANGNLIVFEKANRQLRAARLIESETHLSLSSLEPVAVSRPAAN